jgi:hypothetical protein
MGRRLDPEFKRKVEHYLKYEGFAQKIGITKLIEHVPSAARDPETLRQAIAAGDEYFNKVATLGTAQASPYLKFANVVNAHCRHQPTTRTNYVSRLFANLLLPPIFAHGLGPILVAY